MKVSLEDIEKAAKSVKIAVEVAEKDKLKKEFTSFLEWVEPLLEFDTGNVKPTFYNFVGSNMQRKDVSVLYKDREKLFRTAKNFTEGFYTVPPIIE